MKNCIELSFPVPWGHISAKAWGDPCGVPILAVHGRQDNANSFDPLISKLPSIFYIVAIDLPGHGYSSRLPSGIPLDLMTYVSAVRRIVIQLNWNQFYYIGHSLGGQLGTYYSAMYPENVNKLIVIDSWAPVTVTSAEFTKYSRERIEKTMELENKLKQKSPPSYAYDEALERLMHNRPTFITKDGAETLLPRSLKSKEKNKFYYSTDQRMKELPSHSIHPDVYYLNMGKIICPFLLIMTGNSYKSMQEGHRGHVNLGAVEVFKQNPKFQLISVEGHHSVHIDEPDKVANFISNFILYNKSHL